MSMVIGSGLQRALDSLSGSFFGTEESWLGRWSVRILLSAQYLIGIFVWGSILAWGSPPLEMADWYDVTSPRLRFLQQALQAQQLPLHTASTEWAKGATDRFLAIPDQILSPQIVLLRWLTPGQFALVQVLLMVSLGYMGLLRLRKRCRLSPAAFLPLAWIFFFNGHIVDHMVVGHLTWGGYFLLPFFLELLIDLTQPTVQPAPWRWAAWVALLQGVIFWQGSFHLFNLNLIVLLILIAFYPSRWKMLLAALAGSLLVSAARILPAALVAGQLNIYFSSGFTSLNELLQGLVELKTIARSLESLTPVTSQVAWWEFDYFVGWAGLAWLLGFGVTYWARQAAGAPQRRWLAAMAAIAVLSVGRVYNVIFVLHIPLLTGERVTSRFLIWPLLVVALLAAAGMQRWMNEHVQRPAARWWAFAGGFVLLASDLRQHYEVWRVSELSSLFLPLTAPIPMDALQRSDPLYSGAMIAGLMVSLVSLVGVGILLTRKKSI